MAQSGNRIDIGAVYQLLVEMSARLDSHDRKLDQLLDVANEHARTLAEHTRRLDDLAAGLNELSTRVADYHEAVISQGIHYSKLDGRVRYIERHLTLAPDGG
ncbi:MAG: hypothetical protein ACM3JG_10715 [Thiohalocapsa sp.]